MNSSDYDPACEVLARHFLGSMATERLVRELSVHLQQQVEHWFEFSREVLVAELQGKYRQGEALEAYRNAVDETQQRAPWRAALARLLLGRPS